MSVPGLLYFFGCSLLLIPPVVVEGLFGGKVIMCYVAQWSVYRNGAGKFSMSDIDPHMCTHLVYAYAGLNGTTYRIISKDPAGDHKDNGTGLIAEITALKQINPSLKILVSVGGWSEGSVNYSNMVANSERRKNFVNSVLDYLRDNNFDGIDLAWAYPGERGGTSEDKQNLVLLLKEMRENFDQQNYTLTIQLNPQKYFIDIGYDMPQISNYVHYMNLATHYYHQPWGNKTGPNAPLRTADELNIEFSVNYMMKRGGAPKKMLLGFPTYGVPFRLAAVPAAAGTFMSLPTVDQVLKGPFTNEEGLLAFYEICGDVKNTVGWTEQWDDESSTPVATNGRTLYAYDNVRSFSEKLKFLTAKGLGGASVWWLDTDDFSGSCSDVKYPLVNTISDYFNKTKENVGASVTLMCYVAQWSVYRGGPGKFSLSDIDPHLCSHVIYAYAGLNGTSYQIVSRHPAGEFNNDGKGLLAEVTELKKINPSLKILVSVGGWLDGSANYSAMAASQHRRATFKNSVLDYLKTNNFDGLDLAWSYPGVRGGVKEDKDNLILLLKEMREDFDRLGYLLTVQLNGQKYFIDTGYNMSEISNHVHYINMLTHYYNQPWNLKTGPNSPLNSPDEQNLVFSVEYMIKSGGEANKMLLGIPTYGVPYQLVEKPTSPSSYMSLASTEQVFKGPFTNEEGLVAYYEICEDFKNTTGRTLLWDEASSTPFAINGRKFYSYDDKRSIKAKLELLRRKGLGGATVWWLDTDDFSGRCTGSKYPLVNYIRDNLRCGNLDDSQSPSESSVYNVTVVSYFYGWEFGKNNKTVFCLNQRNC